MSPAATELGNFLSLLTDTSWLSSPNPFASFAQSVDVGGVTLSLGGDISGVEFLLGWDDALAPNAGPAGAGVRVRQISAILNIGIAMSNSGSNTAISLVSGANTTTSSDVQALISSLAATELGTSANGSALARISSGDASAIGSDAVVKICQAFQDALTCAATPPPAGTVDPRVIPGDVSGSSAVPAAVPASAPASAPAVKAASAAPGRDSDGASLPFTGSNPQALLLTAIGLIGAGGVLARRHTTR